MKFSYNWLKQLVAFDKTPEELAEDLSLKSVEIEGIEKFGGDFLENVVVGEIKEIEKHPNADKLQVAMVDIGASGSALSQIICGASNIAVGQKVPVARPGARLPADEIKMATIRGVESYGMLCAPDELGFGTEHAGIMILDHSLPIGKKLSEIYTDWILEGAILSNRGDLQNHLGLAREIAAIYNKSLKEENILLPEVEAVPSTSAGRHELSLQVKNQAPEACPLYLAQVIKNVKIAPSPMWLQQRLLACGMKPINNVVDITNFVMLEQGNPLHAFDYSKLAQTNAEIIIRLSTKSEKIKTLDDKEHELPEGLLVIADREKPIAVAGVMGGADSEIGTDTTDIILESANFSSPYIRRSQRALGLRTEASSRFEKGLSPYLAEMSLTRATQLLQEIAGGELVGEKIVAGDWKREQREIAVDFDKIKNYLSIDITEEKFWQILETLGFEKVETIHELSLRIPLWRIDINIWQDIAEEVGRIYGLDKVAEKALVTQTTPNTPKALYFDQTARKSLVSLGLTEVFSYAILGSDWLAKTKMLAHKHYFEITNPLNEYDYVMRSGLWAGLLKYAVENAKKFERFALFDLTKVYLPSEQDNVPSKEEKHLAILVYGEDDNEGLFVAKKYLDSFAEKFGLQFQYENDYFDDKPYKHPGRNAIVNFSSQKIGRLCEIHPNVLREIDIKKRVWMAEINFDALVDDAKNIEEGFAEIPSSVIFQEFSRFEVSKRDIAFVVDASMNTGDLADSIKSMAREIISVELFDEFKSAKLGEGKKSLAYHIVMQSAQRTLTDQEINQIMKLVSDHLVKDFGAQIR
ncbi:phenylalanine--tRNA ligase subunit beta [Candidatus Microgenomates bacterium]|nr:phenylalanine--tRNA ligase subunit beta [Candidatus Microgenomates bacterium]